MHEYAHLDLIKPTELKTIEGPKGRFYITPEGNKYPSITTVLSAGDKQWLKEWRASMGFERADREMKRAAERGTAIHLMVERLLNNEADPTRDQKAEHIPGFKQLMRHLKRINNIYTQETALWSDIMRVAGRVDCVGEFDGQLSIIDFKTSTNDKSSHMIEDYFLQTAAYSLMFEERYQIPVDNIVILMAVERGAVPLVFKRKAADYFAPAIQRINNYHKTYGETR